MFRHVAEDTFENLRQIRFYNYKYIFKCNYVSYEEIFSQVFRTCYTIVLFYCALIVRTEWQTFGKFLAKI